MCWDAVSGREETGEGYIENLLEGINDHSAWGDGITFLGEGHGLGFGMTPIIYILHFQPSVSTLIT